MNAHFPQVENKSQVFPTVLVALAVCIMLILGLARQASLHVSIPETSIHAAQSENTNIPTAVPVPTPPAVRQLLTATPDAAATRQAASMPQAISAPSPSVP